LSASSDSFGYIDTNFFILYLLVFNVTRRHTVQFSLRSSIIYMVNTAVENVRTTLKLSETEKKFKTQFVLINAESSFNFYVSPMTSL